MKLRKLFAKWVLLPFIGIALLTGLIGILSLAPHSYFLSGQVTASGLPITKNETLRIFSQVVGATSLNGHYLTGSPADTFKAVPETTYAVGIWGMRRGVLLVRDTSLVSGQWVDSAQVSYSLSWDGSNSGANWTQPRTVKSTSYATNKPSIPDTFMFACRGILDTTVSITATALTGAGWTPTYFWPHTDSTTVQSNEAATMPYIRFIFTPKARNRTGASGNAPLLGLRAEFHQIYEVDGPYKTGGP